MFQKTGNHPNAEKKKLWARRPFSEQLSEFRGILGATLGVALMTLFEKYELSHAKTHSRSDSGIDGQPKFRPKFYRSVFLKIRVVSARKNFEETTTKPQKTRDEIYGAALGQNPLFQHSGFEPF